MIAMTSRAELKDGFQHLARIMGFLREADFSSPLQRLSETLVLQRCVMEGDKLSKYLQSDGLCDEATSFFDSGLLAIGLHKRGAESAQMMTNASGTLRSWVGRGSTFGAAVGNVMTANAPSRVPSIGELPQRALDSGRCSCDMALQDGAAKAYNEEAFRYFLEIERKRSESSTRPLLLLLVDIRGADDVIVHATATQLFAGLAGCLRETDFVGWYRENLVIGAVLTQRPGTHRSDMVAEISDRILGRLTPQVAAGLARRLQLRVFQLPGRLEDDRLD